MIGRAVIRLAVGIAVLHLAAAVAWVQEGDESLDQVTLQLRFYHQFQFAGYYAAIEQGYYADVGLEVTLREPGPVPSADPFESVLAGRADYAVSGSGAVINRSRGDPIVVLAAIFQHSPLVLIVPEWSDVRQPHDVVGRQIQVPPTPRTAEVQAMLIREGVDLTRVDLVLDDVPYPDFLFDRRVDAMSGYATNEPYVMAQRGIDTRLIEPVTYGIDFYGDVLVTSERELRRNPDRAARFRAASLSGWEYAMEHPDEIIDVILEKYGSTVPRAKLEYEARIMGQYIAADLIEIGHMNPGRWEHIAAVYRELDMLESSIDTEAFLYDPEAERTPAWLRRLATLALVVAGAILVIVIVLSRFNARLRKAVAQRTQELERSESRFRAVWEIASDAMALSDREGTVLAANEAYLELYGLTEDEVVGKDFSVIFPEDAREDARQGYRQVFDAASPPSTHRSEVVRSDGSTRVVESRIAFVTQEGRRTAMLSIIRDVTEREEHARALEVALSERETLLRELYHRTKNNMQVIESMIALEASQADQRAPGELFSALTSRIHAMGLVHQKLYQSSDLTKIQLDEYLRDLITVILAATDAGERVQPRMDVTSVAVSIEIAVPLGLVLNELITNAAKHAFPDSATGTISISARLEGSRLVVTVEDDGVGLPADASSLATSSMGMGIATSIVEGQLGGSVRFENAPGVRCVIDVDTGSYSVAGASLPDSNERSDRTRNDNTLN